MSSNRRIATRRRCDGALVAEPAFGPSSCRAAQPVPGGHRGLRAAAVLAAPEDGGSIKSIVEIAALSPSGGRV